MKIAHTLTAVAMTALLLALSIDHGWLLINEPSNLHYPVRGIDVSRHQGAIDWDSIRGTGLGFVYIKATEGADWRDHRYVENAQGAAQAGLLRGAYHFFTLTSTGFAQAENFIATAPRCSSTLSPVVDVEVHQDSPGWTTPATAREQLDHLLQRLESFYRQVPLLYATAESHHLLLAGHWERHPRWQRSMVGTPANDWLFWQYSNRGRIPGIGTFVDLNVYRGTRASLQRLAAAPYCNKSEASDRASARALGWIRYGR